MIQLQREARGTFSFIFASIGELVHQFVLNSESLPHFTDPSGCPVVPVQTCCPGDHFTILSPYKFSDLQSKVDKVESAWDFQYKMQISDCVCMFLSRVALSRSLQRSVGLMFNYSLCLLNAQKHGNKQLDYTVLDRIYPSRLAKQGLRLHDLTLSTLLLKFK